MTSQPKEYKRFMMSSINDVADRMKAMLLISRRDFGISELIAVENLSVAIAVLQ
ncbi:hypothetical protein Csa_018867 [Cucumis sativus]|uniref:MarR family transcriptional regulator n=1 Tax=Cucumis sativus TaxID=3659 RepID=A0A0A0KMC4_CUCSA|nr:hypothetical protein Csa_018867 [Cucumis sativus]